MHDPNEVNTHISFGSQLRRDIPTLLTHHLTSTITGSLCKNIALADFHEEGTVFVIVFINVSVIACILVFVNDD